MELLLHYCWKHKLFPLKELETTDGQAVEVIDPGQSAILYQRQPFPARPPSEAPSAMLPPPY